MLPYRIGDPVTFKLGDRALTGRVSGVTPQHVEVSFPLEPWQGGPMGVLNWPDGLAQAVEVSVLRPETVLTMRVPADSIPRTVQSTAPAPSSAMAAGAEMRRSVRVPCNFPLEIRDLLPGDSFPAITQDISSGGVRLVTKQALIVGREYMLAMPLQDSPILVRGRVLRRLGPNVYTLKFLGEREIGHRIMSALFARTRGEQTPAKPRQLNFRRQT